jgi:hypothetical protein
MTSAPVQRSAVGPWIVAGLAAAAHLVVGFFYAVSGLAIPLYALVPLWIFWIACAFYLLRLAIRRSWWTPAVPVVAAAVLVLTAMFGDAVLGWTA